MADFDFIQRKLTFPEPDEVNFDFGAGAYRFIAGQSNIFSAIWADPTAGKDVGKFYVASQGDGAAFSVVDLKLKVLYDWYTTGVKGRANQTLKQNDPKDIVI